MSRQKVEIYETETGKFVVGIANITCWQGEKSSYSAEAFDSRGDAISYVEEHAPELAPELAETLQVADEVK